MFDNNTNNNELVLTNEARAFLKETGKWAQFLAIIGFIGLGFMVIAAFSMGALMSSMSSVYAGTDMAPMMGASTGFVTVLYLLIAALYFFPIMYLYKFSVQIKQALVSNDDEILAGALSQLKSHYKFIGILMAIFVGLYLLMFLMMFVGMGVGAMM